MLSGEASLSLEEPCGQATQVVPLALEMVSGPHQVSVLDPVVLV